MAPAKEKLEIDVVPIKEEKIQIDQKMTPQPKKRKWLNKLRPVGARMDLPKDADDDEPVPATRRLRLPGRDNGVHADASTEIATTMQIAARAPLLHTMTEHPITGD
eukprot:6745327-Heterocapsa_arctica.AAC.1